MNHDFPGNARELENIIEHAFVLCSRGLIELQHLPLELRYKKNSNSGGSNAGLSLKSLEALHIADALRRNDGSRKAAAEELGIHPSTLFRKIKELDVDTPTRDGRSRNNK